MDKKNKITKDMTLGEIVSKFPESAGIMTKYGLHCVGCHVAAWETLEDGAKAHGLDKKKIEKMVKELNEISEGKHGKEKNNRD